MLLFKEYLYLTEARAKDIKAKYPHLAALPDKHLSSYGEWLGRNVSPTDNMKDVLETIETFHNIKNSMHKDDRDINVYDNFDSLRGNVRYHVNKKKQEQEQEQAIVPVHKGETLDVNRVDSKQACIKSYGGGKTRWCVAARSNNNPWDDYRQGSLGETRNMYTIHTHDGNVFAYHEGEHGVMRDWADNEVSMVELKKRYPELGQVKELRNSRFGALFKHDEKGLDKIMSKTEPTDDERIMRRRIVEGSEELAHKHKYHPDSSVRASATKWESVADDLMRPKKTFGVTTRKPESNPSVLAAIAQNHPDHAEVLYRHPDPVVRGATATHSAIAEKLLDNGESDLLVRMNIKEQHPDLWKTHPNGAMAEDRWRSSDV